MRLLLFGMHLATLLVHVVQLLRCKTYVEAMLNKSNLY